MYKILSKVTLVPTLHEFVIEAPRVAKRCKAGQFIILRIHEEGERIPLTIADFDREKGTITIVFQEVGKSTKQLGALNAGDSLLDFVGPLGEASHIDNYGTVVCVAGGVGIAPVYPIARSLKEAGNEVIGIMGCRCKDLLFWEDRMKDACTELRVTTDDGSYVCKGFVTDKLLDLINERGKENIAQVIAIGPVPMMRAVANLTRDYGIKTIVSLNSTMVDGTGMCGCCRVTVGGEVKFSCVDGPEFDGHAVDFDEMMRRSRIYKEEEQASVDKYNKKSCTCSCGCGGAK